MAHWLVVMTDSQMVVTRVDWMVSWKVEKTEIEKVYWKVGWMVIVMVYSMVVD